MAWLGLWKGKEQSPQKGEIIGECTCARYKTCPGSSYSHTYPSTPTCVHVHTLSHAHVLKHAYTWWPRLLSDLDYPLRDPRGSPQRQGRMGGG